MKWGLRVKDTRESECMWEKKKKKKKKKSECLSVSQQMN